MLLLALMSGTTLILARAATRTRKACYLYSREHFSQVQRYIKSVPYDRLKLAT